MHLKYGGEGREIPLHDGRLCSFSVVRIVTRRTVPYRSSLSASESGNDAPELPHMAFTKETRAANSLPYLEPAEMLECETSL